LISAVIHYLERLVDFWRQAGGLVAGNQKLLSEIIWPHFWAIQIILFVLIAAYCTVHADYDRRTKEDYRARTSRTKVPKTD